MDPVNPQSADDRGGEEAERNGGAELQERRDTPLQLWIRVDGSVFYRSSGSPGCTTLDRSGGRGPPLRVRPARAVT